MAIKGISDEKCKEMINIIKETALKLSDPSYVREVSEDESNSIIINGKSVKSWGDFSLADGYASLAVLFGELANIFPDEEWDLIGHRYMIAIKEVLNVQSVDILSLFGGACGIGFAANALSFNGQRYNKFITSINDFIIQVLPGKLSEIVSRDYTKIIDYDVIQGLSGIGRYLQLFLKNLKMKELLEDILRYMVDITENEQYLTYSIPKWYINQQNQFTQRDKEEFPKGSFNFGLSHGITGPLALMSISLSNGIEVSGQRDAIRRIVETINKFIYVRNGTVYWPGRVKFEEFVGEERLGRDIERASWCYGTPGIARAIFLAGKALNDEKYKSLATKTLADLFSLPERFWMLTSPTFCHGYSSLLRICQHMYLDTGMEIFQDKCNVILDKILKFYDPKAPFNFRDIEVSIVENQPQVKEYNNSGLLQGTTGIILTLLGTIYSNKVPWDCIFLIS